MNIEEKVVVVTGGAGGIGAALCRRFAKEGARLVVADIDGDEARTVADQIGGRGVRCDAGREEDIIGLVRQTEAEFGPVDIFCSNAGIMIKGDLGVTNAEWHRIWEVNLMSHVYAARATIPGMLARGGGWFIITASAAGLLSQIGSAPYSTTKHAAVGLAENLAITYGDHGLKVSAICPQAVRTDMTLHGGGVAALDGMLEADQVADCLMEALEENRFMVLPHPEVKTYMAHKATDYERWIRAMQRLKMRFQPDQSTRPSS